MPHYFIRLINDVFDVRDDGRDYQSLEAATHASLLAAADVLKDLVEQREDRLVVDARVEDGDGALARHSVRLSIVPIDTDSLSAPPAR